MYTPWSKTIYLSGHESVFFLIRLLLLLECVFLIDIIIRILLKLLKKSRIRETENLSTDADSRTDTITFFHQEIAGDGRVLIEETEF